MHEAEEIWQICAGSADKVPYPNNEIKRLSIENNLRKSLGLDIFENYENFTDSDLDEISDKKDEIILKEAAQILIDQIIYKESSRLSFVN